MFLIEPDHDGCGSHNKFNVIAIGFFDMHDDPLTSLGCTRLINGEGLLLRLDGNSSIDALAFSMWKMKLGLIKVIKKIL